MGDELRALWAARSVAVVGASNRPGTPGRLAVEFLLRYGYSGAIRPIHPSAGEIAGLPAYPSVVVAGGAELALVLVPAVAVAGAVDDCAEAGVLVTIVGTSGFAETGAEGRAEQDALASRARAGGMRLVGPNCIGAVGFAAGLVASFSPLFSAASTRLTTGRVGFASASGALGYGAVSLALDRGMGLYAAVTTGNEADVTAIEALAVLAGEPGCAVLLGCVESLADGPALRALAAAGKPTALLVAGRSAAGARAAVSHTGALATPDRVVDGALRQLGIVRVSDVDDLLDVGDAFTMAPRLAGPRLAVVTTSGGSGILAADAIAEHGLELANLSQSTVDELTEIVPPYGSVANPVDVTATVVRDRTLVTRALAAVAGDDQVDAIVVCFCVLVGEDVDAIVAALGAAAARSGKPVLAVRTGASHLAPLAAEALRVAGIPTYLTPARAVRAVAALWRHHATMRPRPAAGAALPAPGSRRSSSCQVPKGAFAPDKSKIDGVGVGAGPDGVGVWLAEAGVPVPRGRLIRTPEEAPDAVAEALGWVRAEALGQVECVGRAVLKVVVPGLAHKTEVGGVVLGVTPATAEATAARLFAIPGATAVLVEEQLAPGVELLVGVAPSPLGPALTIGAGGVLAEALDDVAVRLLPVTEDDVREQLAETRVARLLAGHRGQAPSDVDAFVELVCRVAELAVELPAHTALDLNPVVVHHHGAVVLDAVITDER